MGKDKWLLFLLFDSVRVEGLDYGLKRNDGLDWDSSSVGDWVYDERLVSGGRLNEDGLVGGVLHQVGAWDWVSADVHLDSLDPLDTCLDSSSDLMVVLLGWGLMTV